MQSIVVLFIMSLVVFTMINLVGDPVDMLVNPESLPDEIERVRSDFGLDQPAHIQYIKFLQGALSGDLGNSFIFGRPALALIAERFPATLELATCALIIAIVFGLPLGIYAGLNPKSLRTRIIMGGSVLGISIPTFWLGLMMIIIFSGPYGSRLANTWPMMIIFVLDKLSHVNDFPNDDDYCLNPSAFICYLLIQWRVPPCHKGRTRVIGTLWPTGLI